MQEIALFSNLFRRENLHYCIYKKLLTNERSGTFKSQLNKMANFEKKHMAIWRDVLKSYGTEVHYTDYRLSPSLFLLARKLLGRRLTVGILNIYETTALAELSIADFLNVLNIVPKNKLKKVVDLVTDELYNEGFQHKTKEKGILLHIREVVFGMNDGLVEVLASVAGIVGIYKSNLIAALAGIIIGISGTLSMAVGAYLSSMSQKDVALSQLRLLQLEISAAKERVSKEVGTHYKIYNNLVENLNQLILQLKSKNDPFHKLLEKEKSSTLFKMLSKDKSVFDTGRKLNPTRDAAYVGVFYLIGALIPVFSFFLGIAINDSVYLNLGISVLAASIAIVITATMIALNTNENIIRRVVQSLILSLAAAGATFLIGNLVSSYLGVAI